MEIQDSVLPSTSKTEDKPEDEKKEVKYFQCATCGLRECYEYYGDNPPFVKNYKLLENSYVIEDPFVPPKQNEFIILGTHCIQCRKNVCKDPNCSFYYDGTYCLECAKNCSQKFPKNVQEKINKIITV